MIWVYAYMYMLLIRPIHLPNFSCVSENDMNKLFYPLNHFSYLERWNVTPSTERL